MPAFLRWYIFWLRNTALNTQERRNKRFLIWLGTFLFILWTSFRLAELELFVINWYLGWSPSGSRRAAEKKFITGNSAVMHKWRLWLGKKKSKEVGLKKSIVKNCNCESFRQAYYLTVFNSILTQCTLYLIQCLVYKRSRGNDTFFFIKYSNTQAIIKFLRSLKVLWLKFISKPYTTMQATRVFHCTQSTNQRQRGNSTWFLKECTVNCIYTAARRLG